MGDTVPGPNIPLAFKHPTAAAAHSPVVVPQIHQFSQPPKPNPSPAYQANEDKEKMKKPDAPHSPLFSEIDPKSTSALPSTILSSTPSEPGRSMSGTQSNHSFIGSFVINSSLEVIPSSTAVSELEDSTFASPPSSIVPALSPDSSYQALLGSSSPHLPAHILPHTV